MTLYDTEQTLRITMTTHIYIVDSVMISIQCSDVCLRSTATEKVFEIINYDANRQRINDFLSVLPAINERDSILHRFQDINNYQWPWKRPSTQLQ